MLQSQGHRREWWEPEVWVQGGVKTEDFLEDGVSKLWLTCIWAHFEMEDCFWERTEGPEDLLRVG